MGQRKTMPLDYPYLSFPNDLLTSSPKWTIAWIVTQWLHNSVHLLKKKITELITELKCENRNSIKIVQNLSDLGFHRSGQLENQLGFCSKLFFLSVNSLVTLPIWSFFWRCDVDSFFQKSLFQNEGIIKGTEMFLCLSLGTYTSVGPPNYKPRFCDNCELSKVV